MNELQEWAIQWGVPLNALEDLGRRLMTTIDVPGLTGTEADVQSKIRLDASKQGVRLWRNNVGAMVDDNGNFVRYGLANDSKQMNRRIKSSDLIGIKPGGQFIAREVKAPGWRYTGTSREVAQLRFITLVLSMGGDAKFTTGQL